MLSSCRTAAANRARCCVWRASWLLPVSQQQQTQDLEPDMQPARGVLNTTQLSATMLDENVHTSKTKYPHVHVIHGPQCLPF